MTGSWDVIIFLFLFKRTSGYFQNKIIDEFLFLSHLCLDQFTTLRFGQMASCELVLCRLRCKAYIQVCRGLMIASVCLGFFGAALALVGMKCTKIGGSESTKARLTALSGVHFILCGKQSPVLLLHGALHSSSDQGPMGQTRALGPHLACEATFKLVGWYYTAQRCLYCTSQNALPGY